MLKKENYTFYLFFLSFLEFILPPSVDWAYLVYGLLLFIFYSTLVDSIIKLFHRHENFYKVLCAALFFVLFQGYISIFCAFIELKLDYILGRLVSGGGDNFIINTLLTYSITATYLVLDGGINLLLFLYIVFNVSKLQLFSRGKLNLVYVLLVLFAGLKLAVGFVDLHRVVPHLISAIKFSLYLFLGFSYLKYQEKSSFNEARENFEKR